MRRGTHVLALAVGLALMLLAFGPASAQKNKGGQQDYGYAQGYGQMSPEQMQKMRQIHADYAEEIYDLRGELFAKQQELTAAMAGDEVNTSKVRSLTQEINDLRGKLFENRTEMQMEMRKQDLMPAYGGYGMGPGMMSGCTGMGPGMMHGGQGMGPGMMRGMGPGMMGPGMMHGGRGMGPGMMGPGMQGGGYGMGPGRMGPGMHRGQGMGPGMMYGTPYRQNY